MHPSFQIIRMGFALRAWEGVASHYVWGLHPGRAKEPYTQS